MSVFCFRHSRAYLHALFKSDTAAMHHITIHNIAYQVSAGIAYSRVKVVIMCVFFFLLSSLFALKELMYLKNTYYKCSVLSVH